MQLTFRSYADIARSTQKPNSKFLDYLVPGLCAEAGELAGNYAKRIRDVAIDEPEADRKAHIQKQLKELGDVLWFVAMTAEAYGSSLEEVAKLNNEKLLARQAKNTIGGSGDER
jgi:NTP pyrophosphatase (non-canonical NTP hydrolase)